MKRVSIVIILVIILVLSISFGCAPAAEEPAAEEPAAEEPAIPDEYKCDIDWRQFEGQEIELLVVSHPWEEAMTPLIPEFESLTGMKVKVTLIPHIEVTSKVPADFASGTFTADVFMGRYFDAPKFTLEEWTAPIDEFLNDPTLTDSEWYDLNDFFDSALQITEWGKYRDRIPITTEVDLLIYRKDILEELSLQVPKTFDELKKVAKTISESDLNMYGITVRGGPGLWFPFYPIVRSHGGEYWTADDEVKINSPESIAAVETFSELIKYAPPGAADYDWDAINTAMLNNQAAMFIDSSVIYPRLADPETSTVVGKIGAAPYPEGPAGRISKAHYWSICISNSSESKSQGWLFVEWITSKPIQKKLAVQGIAPPRASVWDYPEFIATYPLDYIDAMKTSLDSSVTIQCAPKAGLHIGELSDILMRKVQEVYMGQKDAQTAMDECAAEWEEVLK